MPRGQRLIRSSPRAHCPINRPYPADPSDVWMLHQTAPAEGIYHLRRPPWLPDSDTHNDAHAVPTAALTRVMPMLTGQAMPAMAGCRATRWWTAA